MLSIALHWHRDQARWTWLVNYILYDFWASFPGSSSGSIVFILDLDCCVTHDGTTMATSVQGLQALLFARRTLPKVTLVWCPSVVMTVWELPAGVVTARRFSHFLTTTRHGDLCGFTEAEDIHGLSTWITASSMASAITLVVFTGQQLTAHLFTAWTLTITALSLALVFPTVPHLATFCFTQKLLITRDFPFFLHLTATLFYTHLTATFTWSKMASLYTGV